MVFTYTYDKGVEKTKCPDHINVLLYAGKVKAVKCCYWLFLYLRKYTLILGDFIY
jgi:hypothetical protein